MKRIYPLLAAAAAALTASGASAASFSVSIGSPVGTPSCGNVSTGPSSTPVSRDLVCPSFDAQAAALFGHVGGGSHVYTGAGYFGTALGISTTSTFSDFVTFTAADPNVTSVPVAANLAFSGTMNTTPGANAGVDLAYSLSGFANYLYSASASNGVLRNDFSVALGGVSGTTTNALLRTGTVLVPVNQPILIRMQISTSAGSAGGSTDQSGRSDFSNSFEVPFGIDAFVLPAGVTANAGDWLVNNRLVGGVPEPASWAMMIAGFGMIGFALRRRWNGGSLPAAA